MPVTLTEVQRIPTWGARAVEPVRVGGHDLLAIPQLAKDIPGGPPGMNGGDSDTDLLLLSRAGGRFGPWATLPAPGGEDAEFFTIGDRSFLAVASIRTGAGPYEFAAMSTIFEWQGDGFAPFQEVPTFAAKQWKHWQIGDRHFLGLAQGVIRPGHEDQPGLGRLRVDRRVVRRFQRIPSRWAYNWHAFQAGGEFFVAHAEHAGPSVLYRWDGTRLRAVADPGRRVRPRVRHLRPTAARPTSSSPASPRRPGCCAWRTASSRRPRCSTASGQGAGRGPVRGPHAAHPGQLHPRHPGRSPAGPRLPGLRMGRRQAARGRRRSPPAAAPTSRS